jgi:hypothetical protein
MAGCIRNFLIRSRSLKELLLFALRSVKQKPDFLPRYTVLYELISGDGAGDPDLWQVGLETGTF